MISWKIIDVFVIVEPECVYVSQDIDHVSCRVI